jgi:UDP-N-acetylglucosamine acyltransferase
MIHKTAIVHSGAHLATDVSIGPYAVIEDNVIIHTGTTLGPYVYVKTGTEIGKGCCLHAGCVLGDDPQDLTFQNKPSYLKIGRQNTFREYTTVHRGNAEGSATVIGNENYLMTCSHVGHNCVIGNNNVLASGAVLAGHVTLEDQIFISGNVGVQQFTTIGRLAMIGGNSRVTKDVPPFMLLKGNSLIWSLNTVGLKRSGISDQVRADLRKAFKILYRSQANVTHAVKELETLPASAEMKHLIGFIKGSQRGICASAYAKEPASALSQAGEGGADGR